ncbi:class I lanthipeptide [Hymenobacter agri]
MKKSPLKINKKTIASILDNDQMQGIKGGYFFSLVSGCSSSLCVSHNNGCGVAVTLLNDCCPVF